MNQSNSLLNSRWPFELVQYLNDVNGEADFAALLINRMGNATPR